MRTKTATHDVMTDPVERALYRQISRRHFLDIAGSVTLGGLLAACGAQSSSPLTTNTQFKDVKVFTMADWGGITDQILRAVWGGTFTRQTGIPVQGAAIDYGKFEQQVKSGQIEWNWLDSEGWFPPAHPELMMKSIDYDKLGVPQSDMVNPKWFKRFAAPAYIYAFIIGYRTDSKQHPKNWQEFYDPSSVPGKRALLGYSPYGSLETLLLGDGVSPSNLYPLDVERGLKKLKSAWATGKFIFWNSGAQSQQLIDSKAVDYVMAWDGRMRQLASAGEPIAIEWNQNFLAVDYGAVPPYPGGDPRVAATEAFLKIMLDPANMALLVNTTTGLSPTRKSALPLIHSDVLPNVPTSNENVAKSAGAQDDDWWGQNFNAVSKRWTEVTSSL